MAAFDRLRLSVVVTGTIVSVKSIDATRTVRTLLIALVVGPALQTLYLTSLVGRPGLRPRDLFDVAVCASLLAVAVTSIESTAVAVNSARREGVLPSIVCSSTPVALTWIGGAVASTGVGFVAGVASLGCAFSVAGTQAPWAEFPGLVALLAHTAVAMSAVGFGVAAASLTLRNSLTPIIPAIGVMTLCCGIVTPVAELPEYAQLLARAIPLSYGVEAARTLIEWGDSVVPPSEPWILVVGAGWCAVGAAVWRRTTRRVRRRGTLDFL